MKNKKVVRLTESQLHNILAESVSQILMEMNADDYKKAMDNPRYRKMMDKVDPRTFARRARGANAQGNPRNDDKDTMRVAAINAWNDQYGKDTYSPPGGEYDRDKDSITMYRGDNGAEYGLNSVYQEKGFPEHAHIQRGDFYSDGTETASHTIGHYGKDGYKRFTDNKFDSPYNYINKKGADVARQMATGRGKYSPEKGWE